MRDIRPPFHDPAVESAFAAFPATARDGLLALRRLIFETAAQTAGVGRIEETLKWGQPAYLTPETKSGSTLRLGIPKSGGFAIYAHCQTTILSDFRAIFPDGFTYEGNRGIHFDSGASLPLDKLRFLVAGALTYHRR
ncbi:DUF1801 domain-containing protein [Acidimangrovimonas pyrenivorans]|uniref:DUF1801 domain-containing protein n=1 Tax=Acidimangrovimonas pyrenivorans TaxID=2030798 RepID=A0ABV7AMA0_9RHOB